MAATNARTRRSIEYKQIHTWKGKDKSAAADGSPKQKAMLSMREHEKDDQKGQGQQFMNAVAQMLLTTLCHARKYLKRKLLGSRGDLCLFVHGGASRYQTCHRDRCMASGVTSPQLDLV